MQRHDSDRLARRRGMVAAIGLSMLGLARAHQPSSPSALHGFELPQPRPLQAFELLDHRGQRFGPRRLDGRWTLLLFGYTHCTDICPTTLADLQAARRRLERDHREIDTVAVFVSIDPARDTQPRLAGYVAHFGDGLVGVRGTAPAVKAFAEQFRVRYAAASGGSPAGAIDHTASVALLGPDGALHAVFMLPLRVPQLAADVARLHAQWQARTQAAAQPADTGGRRVADKTGGRTP